jgi:thiol:disulfide interchange protein
MTSSRVIHAILGASIMLLARSSDASESSPQGDQEQRSVPVFTVGVYDPDRDPAEDLRATIERATTERKRILIEVGGKWCGWCQLLEEYIHESEPVASALQSGFLILKVNFSRENPNRGFLSQYPAIRGYPHLFVLESDGALLRSQSTGVFEEKGSYSERAVLSFLEKWSPATEAQTPVADRAVE